MNTSTTQLTPSDEFNGFRKSSIGRSHEILTDIYDLETNMVVWQRELEDELTAAAGQVVDTMPLLKSSHIVTPNDAHHVIYNELGAASYAHQLAEDMAKLVDMFCLLFDREQAGLRLTTLNNAMCPRFHVDKVPCRLVTTYQGIATEWLENHHVDRSKLGSGNQGKPDEESGIFETSNHIQYLEQGDVALLKGELWANNEGAGLVHRSPQLPIGSRRLLITLDFVDH